MSCGQIGGVTTFTLLSQTLLTPYEVLTPGWVTIGGPRIAAVGAGDPSGQGPVLNLGEHLIVPGFVDLHVHGGAGAQVNGNDASEVAHAVRRLADHHARHGTTALLATTVSDSIEALRETIRGIAECIGDPLPRGARVLGAHLEGPWLSPASAGAQDKEHLRKPTLDELDNLLAIDGDVIRMVTLAPEIDGGLEVIEALVSAGVVAALGHMQADVTETSAAIDHGARHVTHLFNAMPELHHRRPGPVGVALTDKRVTVEVIPDGVHLDPLILGLVLRVAAGRVVAVTDATSATGLPAGLFTLGALEVEVSADRVVLADAPDTLAGSVLTMDRGVANMVAAGASLSVAVLAATATPARVIGEVDRGTLRVGAAADVVVLDPGLRCVATMVGGRVVYDPTGLLEQSGTRG